MSLPPKDSEEPRARRARAKEPSFEAALERLEEIVVLLEAGDRPLQESLKLFEEGIALTRQCADRLDHAQRRIELLTRDAQGRPVLLPFAPGEEPAGDPGADEESGGAAETDDDGVES
ncbi:MAG TPA: exodeoxyribonuclease VII small subunit [Candidatus Polarisedimenticolia bacterium]|nr:exodeoxyribonuclease VII small subunit [Candidatus Polarisedimenticolia bacterium]